MLVPTVESNPGPFEYYARVFGKDLQAAETVGLL
jgi:hypothetical protein